MPRRTPSKSSKKPGTPPGPRASAELGRCNLEISDLVGTWRAAGQEKVSRDGAISRRTAADSSGHLIYTADGFVMVLDRAISKVPAREVDSLTTAQKAVIAAGTVAYFGRFVLEAGTVFHHIETALFPVWEGQVRTRHASLEGDRLTLTTSPAENGDVTSIHWDKVLA